MAEITEEFIEKAKAVFTSQPDMQSVAISPGGMPFVTKAEADRYAKRVEKTDVESTVVSRADIAATEAPAAEGKKEEAKALYTAPDGKALFTNAELKAEVKARNLEVADNKNATLIAALEAADIAAAEASKADAEKGQGEGEGQGEGKTEEPQA